MEAFRAEAGKMEPEDRVAELLSSMRRELVAAKAELPVLAREAERAEADLAHERAELEQCDRRRAMAERIGDGETGAIAEKFGERHRARIAVLEQKVSSTQAELALRTTEAEEMKRRFQEAEANRFGLLAELRRTASRREMDERMSGGQNAFADFERMEEKVAGSGSYAEALEELDAELGGGNARPRPASAQELDAKLQELKKRMGK